METIQTKTKTNPNTTVILEGDFNAPDIDWETGKLLHVCKNRKLHEQVIETLQEAHLRQQQLEPTRRNNTLDLYCTNKPGLTKTIKTISGISDHETVAVDSNLRPQYNKKKPRKVYKYYKADWDKIHEETKLFTEQFIATSDENSVNENWNLSLIHI